MHKILCCLGKKKKVVYSKGCELMEIIIPPIIRATPRQDVCEVEGCGTFTIPCPHLGCVHDNCGIAGTGCICNECLVKG